MTRIEEINLITSMYEKKIDNINSKISFYIILMLFSFVIIILLSFYIVYLSLNLNIQLLIYTTSILLLLIISIFYLYYQCSKLYYNYENIIDLNIDKYKEIMYYLNKPLKIDKKLANELNVKSITNLATILSDKHNLKIILEYMDLFCNMFGYERNKITIKTLYLEIGIYIDINDEDILIMLDNGLIYYDIHQSIEINDNLLTLFQNYDEYKNDLDYLENQIIINKKQSKIKKEIKSEYLNNKEE